MALMGQPFQGQGQKPTPPKRDLASVVPKSTLSAMPPNAQQAASDAYRRGGPSYLKQQVTGQPWANEVNQALAAGAGAAQNDRTGMRPAAQSPSGAPPMAPAGYVGGPSASTDRGLWAGPDQKPAQPTWQQIKNSWDEISQWRQGIPPELNKQWAAEAQQIAPGGGARAAFWKKKMEEWKAQQGGTPGPTDPPQQTPPFPTGGTDPSYPTAPNSDVPPGPIGSNGSVDPAILQQILGANGGGFFSPF